MKKLLALVLALVMTLSLCVVSSNAAYTDAADVELDEAVDVLTAVGVFQGSDGKFDPKANLTREQAAKLVAYLQVGQKAADALVGGGKFTDVAKDRWSAGYVDYCASIGIAAGVGGSKFDPTGSLTALQFGKMLLVCLGYDAKTEGMVGTDWTINTSKLMASADLLTGLDAVTANSVVTREQAAQMMLNALKAPMVGYDTKATSISVNGADIVFGGSTASYVTSTVAKMQTISDEQLTNSDAYTIELGEKLFPKLELVWCGRTEDDLGRPTNEWVYDKNDVGTYVKKNELLGTFTAKVTAKMLYDLVGKSVADDITSNNKDLYLTSRIDGRWVDVAVHGSYATKYLSKDNTTKVNNSGNGTVTEVYMDDDKNVTIVTYETYLFQAVSDYNATKDTLTLTQAGDTAIILDTTVLDGEDFEITEYKADDYILVTVAWNGNRYEVQTIEPATVVTGKVDGYKVEDSVDVDGKTYKYNNTTKATGGVDNVKATLYTVDQNTVLVLDKYDNILAVDDVVVSDSYVFVTEFGNGSGLTNSNKAYANVTFTDGTTDTVVIKAAYDKTTGNQVTNKTTIANWGTTGEQIGWFTYSKNSNDEYTLYRAETKYTEQASRYEADVYTTGSDTVYQLTANEVVKFLNKNATGASIYTVDNDVTDPINIYRVGADTAGNLTIDVKANDGTLVIVDDGDDVYTYEGVKNVPDTFLQRDADYNKCGKATVYALKNSSNYVSYVYITLNDYCNNWDAANTGLLYIVKYDGEYRVAENDTDYKYVVLDGVSEKKVQADEKFGNYTGKIFSAAYKTRTDADGVYTAVNTIPAGGDGKYFQAADYSDITYSKGTLNIIGDSFTVADNAEIYIITLGNLDLDGDGTKDTDARALNKDKAADYEVSKVSAKELANLLDGYRYIYVVQGKTTEAYGSVIEQLYVTVYEAAYITNETFDVAATSGLTFSEDKTTLVTSLTQIVPGTEIYVLADDATVKPVSDAIRLTATGVYETASHSQWYSFIMPAEHVYDDMFDTEAIDFAITAVTLAYDSAADTIVATVTANAALTNADPDYKFTLEVNDGTDWYVVGTEYDDLTLTSGNGIVKTGTTGGTCRCRVTVNAEINGTVVATYESRQYSLTVAP